MLYNGNLAFDKAKKEIDDAYQDDFTKILPIEPLKIEDNKEKILALPTAPNSKMSIKSPKDTKTQAQGFKKAEEKAVKAVQKHSMSIGTKEKNKQIDDAYFLLGKSRYYDQRFIPALETFKYMIKKYPTSDLFHTARIWEAKTLVRLGQEEDAIYKLDKYLTKTKDLPDNIVDNAHTALAMAYTKMDSTQQVINHLNQALAASKKNYNQATRNRFILGQLYRTQNKIDSSNTAFLTIAQDKKAPYRFRIYADLERAKNYNKDTDNAQEIIDHLKKLAKNRDNRPYLDGIYYQIGKIELTNKNTKKAIDYFKKSLLAKQAKDTQKDLAYEQLGNIYFDNADFITSGAYYDSVINLKLDEKSKRFRKITRIRKSLDRVIQLENTIHKKDSILNLVAMNDTDRTTFFKKYIKELKKKDKEAKIIEQNKKGKSFSGFGELGEDSKKGKNGAKFYFYNLQSVSFGEAEFAKIWGNRPLEDNWRLSNKTTRNENEENQAEEELVVDDSKKYDLDYYLSTIPNNEQKIDSLTKIRNKAYYKVGVLYKEQFNKNEIAVERLEKLISIGIENTKLELPTYYHLYKAYLKLENNDKSNFYKDKIVAKFPDSRYAKLILNPNTENTEEDLNSPENQYKKIYNLYVNKEYNKVIDESTNFIQTADENKILAKFELLKAQAIAKTKGKDAYIKALTFVVNTYPSTPQAERAQEILNFLLGVTPKKQTKKETEKTEKEKINRLKRPNNQPSKEEMLERIKKKRKSLGPPTMKKKD